MKMSEEREELALGRLDSQAVKHVFQLQFWFAAEAFEEDRVQRSPLPISIHYILHLL